MRAIKTGKKSKAWIIPTTCMWSCTCICKLTCKCKHVWRDANDLSKDTHESALRVLLRECRKFKNICRKIKSSLFHKSFHYGIIFYMIAAGVCGLCLRELDASGFLFYILANTHIGLDCVYIYLKKKF